MEWTNQISNSRRARKWMMTDFFFEEKNLFAALNRQLKNTQPGRFNVVGTAGK